MLYDLTHKLCDHRGKPITDIVDGKPTEFTLGAALERAAMFGGNPQTTAQQKFEQYKLAQKLASSDHVELTAEEVSRLKELTGAMFTPIAVGAVWTALENPLTALPDFSPGLTA